ncbi:MAG: TIGR00366 family protein [Algoriphagus sp.]|nr:TIGR00366 family protein [Algoriphagus sp.]
MENNTTKNIFKSFLSPVGLVLLLTLMTFTTGYILMDQTESDSSLSKVVRLLAYWQEGFFSLLGFTLQMIMILVFGYALAVFAPINRVLKVIAGIPKNLTAATLLTAVITSFAGFLIGDLD